jgi:hypothetical protein
MGFMSGLAGLFVLFLFFLISIAIMRWAFRINDIVERLDRVIQLLERPRA